MKTCIRIAMTFMCLLLATNTIAAKMDEISLDGSWRFQRDPSDVGVKEGWIQPKFDDSKWETMKVPGDWGEGIDGIGWYRKTITIPDETSKSDNLRLVFKSVDDEATVYLNGRLAITSASWTTPFASDPRKFMAQDHSLAIAVRVKDNGGGGGILGSVTLQEPESLEALYTTKLHEKSSPYPLDNLGSMVLYSVYTRNFTPEGTFKALEARLPELKKLGVTTLWLLPIHEIGVEKRKGADGSPYAIKDYYSVDPALGTKDDFRALVKAIHAQGMTIIIDCVLNHTSPDSVWATENPELFLRDESGKPKPMVSDWSDVVDLDWTNKSVYEEAAKMLEYWVRDFDIDGYRCDVADRMPDEFWAMVRKRLDALKPNIFMLAESQDARHYFSGFDMVYCDGPRDVMHSIIENGAPATAMRDEILNEVYGNPKKAVRMLFVENHDKPRAAVFFKTPEQLKAAAYLTVTLPGVPLLYSGTEIGVTADRDKTFFEKVPIDWSKDPNRLREFWTTLLKMRSTSEALQSGDIRLVPVKPEEQILAFDRTKNDDRVRVLLNLSNKPARVTSLDGKDASLPISAWGVIIQNGSEIK